MIPDAYLSAFVEAKGCREAIRAVAGVQTQLEAARKEAVAATAAVARFGRVRATAVVKVDASNAHTAIVEASREVERFGAVSATATRDIPRCCGWA